MVELGLVLLQAVEEQDLFAPRERLRAAPSERAGDDCADVVPATFFCISQPLDAHQVLVFRHLVLAQYAQELLGAAGWLQTTPFGRNRLINVIHS